jgi:hypothetical protein
LAVPAERVDPVGVVVEAVEDAGVEVVADPGSAPRVDGIARAEFDPRFGLDDVDARAVADLYFDRGFGQPFAVAGDVASHLVAGACLRDHQFAGELEVRLVGDLHRQLVPDVGDARAA